MKTNTELSGEVAAEKAARTAEAWEAIVRAVDTALGAEWRAERVGQWRLKEDDRFVLFVTQAHGQWTSAWSGKVDVKLCRGYPTLYRATFATVEKLLAKLPELTMQAVQAVEADRAEMKRHRYEAELRVAAKAAVVVDGVALVDFSIYSDHITVSWRLQDADAHVSLQFPGNPSADEVERVLRLGYVAEQLTQRVTKLREVLKDVKAPLSLVGGGTL